MTGAYLNIFYSLFTQQVSYQGIGEYLADNVGSGGRLTGKRVCILEDPAGKSV